MTTEDQVQELIRSSHDLAQSSRDMAEAANKQTLAIEQGRERDSRARKRFYTILTALGALFVAFSAGVLTILLVVLSNQDSIQKGQQASEDARSTLLDCVVPGGQCFKDSQQRTADALTLLNQTSVVRDVCVLRFTHEPIPAAILDTLDCIKKYS
jgi:hypothetical protein